MMSRTAGSSAENRRIDSWKEIAAFFGRDERTVKRWEKERALPVHRLPGERGGVFAYTEELARWLNSAAGVTGNPPAAAPPVAPVSAAAPEFAPAPANAPRLPSRSWLRISSAALLAVLLAVFFYAFHGWRHIHQGRAAASPAHDQPDPEAQEFYLKGRYYWSRRTEGSLTLAVDAFTQAVVHDSNYAQAYAGLAECYDIMPEFTSMPRSEAFPRAIAAAGKAIALDSSLASAHRALAFGLFYWEWKIPQALNEYQRALALDPHDEEAHHWYATSLFILGRSSEALVEIDKARQINPTSRSILADQAFIRYSAGDRAAALGTLHEMERTDPDFASVPRYLAGIAWDQKDDRNWIAQSKRLADLSKDPQIAAVAQAAEHGFAKGGQRSMLEAMRITQQQYFDAGQSTGFELARTCARLGRKDEAFAYLKAAVGARDYLIFTIGTDPTFAGLLGDPVFEALRRQITERMYRS